MIYNISLGHNSTQDEIEDYIRDNKIILVEYDVIRTSYYRATGTWLYYKNDLHLMRNGGGYLEIHKEFNMDTTDAISRWKYLTDIYDIYNIQVKGTDNYIKKILGKKLPENFYVYLVFEYGDYITKLYITFPNNEVQSFYVNEKTWSRIIGYWTTIDCKKTSINVKINITNKEDKKLFNSYERNKIYLPGGWTNSVPGCINGSLSHIKYVRVYKGPESSKDKTLEKLNNYYKDFTGVTVDI